MPPKNSNPLCLICERRIACAGMSGVTHKTSRVHHYDCADTIGHTRIQAQAWLFADCKEVTGGYDTSQFTTNSPPGTTPTQSLSLQAQSNQEIDMIDSHNNVFLAADAVFQTSDIVTFEIQWEPSQTGSPIPNSNIPFYQCEAEQPELTFFAVGTRSWAHLQDVFLDEDVVAENPYYKYLSDGCWNVLDALAQEVEKHAATRSFPHDRDDMKAQIFQVLTSLPLPVLLGLCGSGLRARKASSSSAR